jgi:hypothetical protein
MERFGRAASFIPQIGHAHVHIDIHVTAVDRPMGKGSQVEVLYLVAYGV